jgi:DNA-binding transcriptional LysR family regulator
LYNCKIVQFCCEKTETVSDARDIPRPMKYPLSSEACEILLHLEHSENLREIAEKVGRDVSVVSRKLQALASSTPFLTKIQNQWRLTTPGLEFNRWTRTAITEQRRLLMQADVVRIATTREFASRVMAPALDAFAAWGAGVEIISLSDGVEAALLERKADFGFDCGTPYSPSIAFHRGPAEGYVVVQSGKAKRPARSVAELASTPFLFYNRMDLAEIRQTLELKEMSSNAYFNDIATLRSALEHHDGWSVLPAYAVREEIQKGTIRALKTPVELESTTFGLWWNRENAPRPDLLKNALAWLKKQKL